MSDARPMADEYAWTEGGETFRATDTAGWYLEGDDWRRADPDYLSRFLRHELLRVVAEYQSSLAAAKAREDHARQFGRSEERARLREALLPWLQKHRERVGSAAAQELADALGAEQ